MTMQSPVLAPTPNSTPSLAPDPTRPNNSLAPSQSRDIWHYSPENLALQSRDIWQEHLPLQSRITCLVRLLFLSNVRRLSLDHQHSYRLNFFLNAFRRRAFQSPGPALCDHDPLADFR